MIAAQVIRSIVDLPAIYEKWSALKRAIKGATHIRSGEQNHLLRVSSQIDVVRNKISRRTIIQSSSASFCNTRTKND